MFLGLLHALGDFPEYKLVVYVNFVPLYSLVLWGVDLPISYFSITRRTLLFFFFGCEGSSLSCVGSLVVAHGT